MFTSTKALARSPMRAERSQSLRGAATIPHAITRSIIAPYSGCVGWNMLSSYDGCGGGGGGFEQQKPFSTLKQGEHIKCRAATVQRRERPREEGRNSAAVTVSK